MSLFKSADLSQSFSNVVKDPASGAHYIAPVQFISDERLSTLRNTIGALERGKSCAYVTEGAWSNIDLVEFILMQTGPADVYLTTFAISSDALTRLAAWQESAQVTNLYAVLDDGLHKRKPADFQQATGVFHNLRVCKCHAKVMVISNPDYQIAVCGSANFTRNYRKESGIIIFDQSVANSYINWIMEEFKNER
jgi:hypothetical protein